MAETIKIYAAWLEEANRAVLDKEARAGACLAGADYAAAYKNLMAAKAEIIRQLPCEFQRRFPGGNPDCRAAWETIVGHLRRFAAGAENSLAIGSSFYMSALLYPDEHKPGEPNNLELLIAELKQN